jgi:hypothetical protein
MDAQDRIAWQPFLTPRQTRVIDAKLHDRPVEQDDEEALVKLQEWFGTEAEVQRKREKAINDLS